MSILIKGMEMPKHCISEDGLYMPCPMDRLWCMQMFAPEGLTMGQAYDERFGKLPSWCPLVPVPTPHGDLIDRGALPWENQGLMLTDPDEWGLKAWDIEHAPTIIPAEEGE